MSDYNKKNAKLKKYLCGIVCFFTFTIYGYIFATTIHTCVKDNTISNKMIYVVSAQITTVINMSIEKPKTLVVDFISKSDEMINDEDRNLLISCTAERLKRHESFKSSPYQDTNGHWLIGYGTKISTNSKVKPTSTVTKQQAEQKLKTDLIKIANFLDQNISWWNGLDIVRQEAILNMTYNLGLGGILKFEKFLTHVKNENFDDAPKEIYNTKYYRQVGKRATEIANAIRYGSWEV